MNKVYKVIWSKVRNCYVVVSELAKRNGKNTGTTDKRRKVTGGLALAAMAVALNLGTMGMAEAAIAYGTNAKAEGASSIAIGDNAYATKDNNIAVGTYATVGTITQDDARTKAYYALQQTIKDRLNINVVRYATDYTSLIDALDLVISNPVYSDSRRTNASNYKTQLIDLFTVLQKRVDSTNSIAMGNAATAIGSFAIAVGDNAQATAQYAIATGYNARATAQDAIAVGNTAYANGISAIAIGSKARAGKRPISNYDTNIPIDYAIAVGHSAQATETSAVAVGYDARAYTPNSIAIGKSSGIGVNYSKEFDTTMEGENSIAIGTNAKNFTYGFFQNETNYYANTKNAIAIGNQAHTHAANAFAIGVSTDATAARSFAIGTSSTDAVSAHQGTRAGGQGALAFGDSAHVVRKQFINTKEHGAPENRATDTAVNDSFSVGTNTLIQSRNAVSLGGGMSYTYHVISEDGKTMTSKTLYYKKDSEDSGGWVPEALGTGANIGEASDGAVAIGGASATVTPKTDDKGTLIDNTYVNFPTKSPTESLEITDYTAAASIGDNATRAVAIGSGAKIGDNAVNSVAVGARNIVTGKNSTAVGAGHSKYLNSPSYSYSNSVSANESGVLGNNNMVGKQLFSNSDLGLNPDSNTGYVFVVGSDNEINTAKDNQDAYFINVFGTANKVESTVDGVWYSEASTIIGKGNEAKNLAASLVAGNGNGKQFNYPGYDIPLENILHSQIIGNLNTVTDVTDVVVLGNKNTVTGNGGSIAIGVGSTVYGSNAIAVGPGNIVTGLNSTAVGQGNQVAGIGSGAFGDPNQVAGESSFAFGDNNEIGNQVFTSGYLQRDTSTMHVFAVGDGNKIGTAGNATKINVFGSSNTIEGAAPSTNSSIIGNNNEVTDKLTNSLVAGNSNTKLNQVDNSQIIGNSNKIGTNVSNMVVLGNNTTVTDVTSGIDSAIAIGEGTTVEASNAIATGAGAKASKFGSVALGFGSVANREAGKNASDSTSSGYDVITGEASASTTPVWRSNLAAVSVGADGKTTRQITNVAAGIEDTDAVNVAQLKRAAIETDNRNVGLITNADSKREITSPFIHVAGVKDAVENERLAELQRQLVILENQKAALEFAGATADEIAAAESQIYDVKAAIDSLKNNINDAFAQAKGDFSIAIGKGARASAKSTVAIGEGAIASADNALAAGWDSKASKENAVAIGSGSSASASGGVALGSSSVANREAGRSGWDVSTGNKSTDTSPTWRSTLAAVSVGTDGQTRQITNVAAGSDETDAVNVAQLKKAATHYYSVNANDSANPDGTNYLNDGATGAGALAAGRNSKASGENAVAVGSGSSATSAGSFAAGQYSKASSENAVAVGSGSSASVSGGVALGSSSVANREAGRSGWDVSTGEVSTDTSSTWRSNLAAVSVGADGQTRQITNVAAGSEDTDAVNVAQLKRVSDTINDVSNTGLTFGANVGGPDNYYNTTRTNKLGSTIEIKGDGTKDISDYSGKNIQTEITQNADGNSTIHVKFDENPSFTSVTAGMPDSEHNTKMDASGIEFNNGYSRVTMSNSGETLHVGNQSGAPVRITNVAPGTDPTDAVNVAQLNASGWNIIDNIGNKKGTVLNGQNVSFKDGAGTVSTVNYDTMSGTASVSYSVNKANSPISYNGVVTGGTTNQYWDSAQTQNAINQSGFHITTSQSAGTAAYTTMHLVRNGETVTIDAGKNIAITQSETKISVATKDDVEFNRAKVNTAEVTNVLTVGEGPDQVSISNDGIRTGDTILNTEGLTIMGGPSVTRAGIDAGERTITNVKAGTADTDAVNVSQLKEYAATSTELAKAARTEVKAGTNVSSVTEEKAADGHSVYTVNADGTSVSAGSAAVKVEKGVKDANNVTDYSIDLSDATKATLAKAETSGLTFKGDNGSTKQIKLGDTVNITGDNNITTEAAADQMKIKLNKNIDLGNDGSLTTGNTKIDNNGLTTGDTTVSNTGLTITGGPSVTKNNVNMGGNRIQNVGAGTDDSDAVNYGQLKSELKNVASQISSVDSDNRAVTINKEDGKQVVSSPFLHINGVGSNVEEKDKAMANGMESIAIGRGATAEKHLAVAIGTGAEAAIHSSVALGDHSVTTAEDKAGIRTGKYGYDVVTNSQYKGVDRFSPTWQSTAGSVSVGGGVEPATKETVTRRISNVAAGIKDTDVVNVAQLKRAANYLTDHRSTSIGTNANGERVIVSPYLAMHGVEEAAQAKSLIDTYQNVNEYTGALQNDISTLKGEQTNLDRDVTNLTNQISDMDARLAAFNDKTTDEYKELAYERAILDEEKTTLSNELSEVTELLAEREGLLKTADADYEKAWELASDYAQADGEKSFAHGSGTRVTGKESMAQGSDSTVVGNQSIAIGTGQEVYGSNSGAIGDPNVLAAERSYVIGNLNTVGDKNDIQADSDTTKFDTNNVFVFGNDNTVESGKEHVYIFGSNVTKTEKNSVILGNESAVYAEANNRTAGTGVYKSETINGKTYNYAGGDKEVGVVSVGNADAPRRIQNVAPGKVSAESTDAINGSQLYAALDNVNHNVNQSLNDLGDQISNVDNRSKKGIAGAAALAALHPLDFDPDDKLSFAAGMGHYRGETAAALGMFYRPSEKVMLSLGGTMGNGENMVNAGISFSLDRTPRVTGSRTALTKEVVNLREQVAKQDAQIAKQDQQIAMQGAQIAQLTALVSQLTGNKVEIPVVPQVKAPAPFPDNLDNKWAYDRIEELEQQGYISGYAGRALSRNEFAAALDRALAGGATLDERLIKEFEQELSHVRVSHVKGKGDEEGKTFERPRSKAHQYK